MVKRDGSYLDTGQEKLQKKWSGQTHSKLDNEENGSEGRTENKLYLQAAIN